MGGYNCPQCHIFCNTTVELVTEEETFTPGGHSLPELFCPACHEFYGQSDCIYSEEEGDV